MSANRRRLFNEIFGGFLISFASYMIAKNWMSGLALGGEW